MSLSLTFTKSPIGTAAGMTSAADGSSPTTIAAQSSTQLKMTFIVDMMGNVIDSQLLCEFDKPVGGFRKISRSYSTAESAGESHDNARDYDRRHIKSNHCRLVLRWTETNSPFRGLLHRTRIVSHNL